MIGEIALAIEMGADAVDIGKTIHLHPTLGESIGMAAEVGTSLPHAAPQVPLRCHRAGAIAADFSPMEVKILSIVDLESVESLAACG